MAKQLTDAACRALKPGSTRREIRDGGATGLYLVIQPSGHKSWALRYRRPNSKPAKLTLGDFNPSNPSEDEEDSKQPPAIGAPLTLAEARELAAGQLRQRAAGTDPAAKLKADKQAKALAVDNASATAFPTLARLHVDEHCRTRTRRWRGTARLLGLEYPKDGSEDTEPAAIKGGLCQRWKDRDITSITSTDLYGVVDEARRTGVPGLKKKRAGKSDSQGRAMAAALSKFFNWCAEHHRIKHDANPANGMYRPPAPKARSRAMPESELRLFWQATDELSDVFKLSLRLLLLTLQRRNEVGDMPDDELDGSVWTISEDRAKNRRAHRVYLHPDARAILDAVPRIEGCPYVFSTTGKTPISGWSKTKRTLDALMIKAARKISPESVIKPWRYHDLRRTADTLINQELGIAPHIVDAILNHVSTLTSGKAGVAGTYNVAEYAREKTAALAAWARYVALVVDADLFAAHRAFLSAGGDDAVDLFREAIMKNGGRWAGYLKTITNTDAENVIPMRRAEAVS